MGDGSPVLYLPYCCIVHTFPYGYVLLVFCVLPLPSSSCTRIQSPVVSELRYHRTVKPFERYVSSHHMRSGRCVQVVLQQKNSGEPFLTPQHALRLIRWGLL